MTYLIQEIECVAAILLGGLVRDLAVVYNGCQVACLRSDVTSNNGFDTRSSTTAKRGDFANLQCVDVSTVFLVPEGSVTSVILYWYMALSLLSFANKSEALIVVRA